ncbi:MAG: 50S ribosomal protein L24 [Rhabdochlamydiaceae bacterium]|nr:50S ribosomal protein L24 [Rhabdochlamydiaceae bacterium]
MSKWIKKGDVVTVTAGNYAGKVGEVLSRTEDRVVVQGVNIRKKHVKRRAESGPGEIMERERPIHISNVSVCNAQGKPVRLKAKSVEGKKQIYYTDGTNEVVHRQF